MLHPKTLVHRLLARVKPATAMEPLSGMAMSGLDGRGTLVARGRMRRVVALCLNFSVSLIAGVENKKYKNVNRNPNKKTLTHLLKIRFRESRSHDRAPPRRGPQRSLPRSLHVFRPALRNYPSSAYSLDCPIALLGRGRHVAACHPCHPID